MPTAEKRRAEAPSAAFIIVIGDLLPQTHLEPTRTPRAAILTASAALARQSLAAKNARRCRGLTAAGQPPPPATAQKQMASTGMCRRGAAATRRRPTGTQPHQAQGHYLKKIDLYLNNCTPSSDSPRKAVGWPSRATGSCYALLVNSASSSERKGTTSSSTGHGPAIAN